MHILCFYAPITHVEAIKNALFAAGAGKIGNYTHCAWQTLGEGQFMPLAGSDAFIGAVNQLEKVPEYKVEIVCSDDVVSATIQALKTSHPYEEPAYYLLKSI